MVGIISQAKALADQGDYRAIVKLMSGSYRTDIWSAAMTAHFGPTGLHVCSQDPVTGVPSAECLAKIPSVGEVMSDAKKRVANMIAYYQDHPSMA